MRDKYIDLIKKYISQKPQYKTILDEIKRDTLIVGATEDEFEEAIRQLEETPLEKEADNIKADEAKKNKIVEFSQNHKKAVKSAAAILSLFVILSTGILLYNKPFSNNIDQQASDINLDQKTKTALKTNNDVIPVVYANSSPIDANAVFSIGSDNVVLTVSNKPKKEVLGFFPYWMMETWDKIDISALSSISLFGLETNGKGEIITTREAGEPDPGWTMWNDTNLDKLIQKAKNNGLNVYLTVKSFNNSNIQSLALSDDAQKNFVANVSYLISSKNLDGVNIDFEPTAYIEDNVREGFTRLMKNLNTELKRQNPNSALTIDTYLVSGSEQGLFNLPVLSLYTDAFVIMGYDMHTPSGDPGPIAAMGGSANVIGYVQNYLEKVPENKLILAVPYYGYDWPINTGSADTKILPYAQIAESTKDANLLWDENSQTPYYTYKEGAVERIVHFDNIRSLAIKYDFINRKNLKGVGIWALGYDGNNHDLQKLLIDKFINQ